MKAAPRHRSDERTLGAGRVARLVTVVSALAFWALAGCGEDGTGRIVGTVKDQAGKPVGGVKVAIEATGLVATSKDGTGGYVVEGLASGVHAVSGTKTGYRTARRELVRVADGGETRVDLLVVRLPGNGTIKGLVKDRLTEWPVVGAVVLTRPTTAVAVTDRLGRYTVSVPSASYQVVVSARGYYTKVATDVKVGAKGAVDRDLAMDPLHQTSCTRCHTDKEKLKQELATAPPPPKPSYEGKGGC